MPMKKSYFLLLAVLLWGCSTFEEEVLPAPGDSPRQLSVSAVEEPGPDPGSLEIMQRAVDSVAAHSGQRSVLPRYRVLRSNLPTVTYVSLRPRKRSSTLCSIRMNLPVITFRWMRFLR